VELEFTGEVIYWRGPAPFYYVRVPAEESAEIEAVKKYATYGWGCIPVVATIADTTWKTSLFPKDGRFLVPVKDVVRRAVKLDVDDTATVRLALELRTP
jgi:hypothetical protein